ncbi:glycosyltransferase family 39 protein [Deltaproteobacteria bacterium]|nr:glycosyltransferase family 39 protein [Deltaproteobacteria bacterium]
MIEKKHIFYLNTVLIICLAILIVSIIILSLVPPVSKDALVHHLAVPKLYLNHGGMYEIPFMDFSYYPMNLQLLYMIPLYFGNDIAPKFIHFVFALLSAWLIFYYLRRRANMFYAFFGSVFFLSLPIIIKLSTTVYVDLGEIFFSFASLLLILEWLKSDFKIKYLIYSGIMCGLALGTKYNGLVTLALLTFLVPFLYSRYGVKKGLGFVRPVVYGIAFFFISLLVFSPWMIRNYHWKSNPIYPLYDTLINPAKDIKESIDPEEKDVNVDNVFFTYRSVVYHEKGWQIALLPIRIFFQGKDGDPQYFDGKLNPFLFIFPFFAFFRLREDTGELRREKKVLLAFAVLFFGFAFFSAVLRIRYISPMIPPLIILSVLGMKRLFEILLRSKKLLIRVAGVVFITMVVIFYLMLNASYVVSQYKYLDPLSFITGKIGRDEYISKYIPEYPALRYINDNLHTDAKLLFIFLGKRGYYCDREYVFNMEMLKNLIDESMRPEEIIRVLSDRSITHLLVNYSLFERWMSDNFFGEKQKLTQQFFREHLKLLFYINGFGLLELKSPGSGVYN